MPTSSQSATARRRPFALGRLGVDRGATLLEATLVVPILFLIIFGIMEVGGAIKSKSSAANAVRAGGRIASVAGNSVLADQVTLERAAKEAAGLSRGEIEYIAIWHATGPDDSLPPGCVSASSTPNTTSEGVSDGGSDAMGACNVYSRPDAAGGAFDMATGRADQPIDYYFGCTGRSDPEAGHKVDCNWPGNNRQVLRSPRGETPVVNPDYVGVHIQATHTYYTGVLGSTLAIAEDGINLLEPQGYSLTSP